MRGGGVCVSMLVGRVVVFLFVWFGCWVMDEEEVWEGRVVGGG